MVSSFSSTLCADLAPLPPVLAILSPQVQILIQVRIDLSHDLRLNY
jgi:hypothetical protein